MIAEKIKTLREGRGMTQTELARRLGVTRSGVNAWEMGISVPSTQYVVELAQFFSVSTDYLFGIDSTATVSVAGLSDEEIATLVAVANRYRALKTESYQNNSKNNIGLLFIKLAIELAFFLRQRVI